MKTCRGVLFGCLFELLALLMMLAVFGQIPLNDAIVGRYCADEFRARVYAVRYFITYLISGIAIGMIAFLHSRGGFDLVLGITAVIAFGFVAGLPLPLSGFTLRQWLSEGGAALAVIGVTANIALAYSLKFLWSPTFDNIDPPGPLRRLGRRRGWLALIQPALGVSAALLALLSAAT